VQRHCHDSGVTAQAREPGEPRQPTQVAITE
jgi:hypothetical protein